jgi:hypothetical protein
MRTTFHACLLALLVFASGCTKSENPLSISKDIRATRDAPPKPTRTKRERGGQKMENVLGGTLFADHIVKNGDRHVLSGRVFWENKTPDKFSPLLAFADSATWSATGSILVLTGCPVIEFDRMQDAGTSETTRMILTKGADGLAGC